MGQERERAVEKLELEGVLGRECGCECTSIALRRSGTSGEISMCGVCCILCFRYLLLSLLTGCSFLLFIGWMDACVHLSSVMFICVMRNTESLLCVGQVLRVQELTPRVHVFVQTFAPTGMTVRVLSLLRKPATRRPLCLPRLFSRRERGRREQLKRRAKRYWVLTDSLNLVLLFIIGDPIL